MRSFVCPRNLFNYVYTQVDPVVATTRSDPSGEWEPLTASYPVRRGKGKVFAIPLGNRPPLRQDQCIPDVKHG